MNKIIYKEESYVVHEYAIQNDIPVLDIEGFDKLQGISYPENKVGVNWVYNMNILSTTKFSPDSLPLHPLRNIYEIRTEFGVDTLAQITVEINRESIGYIVYMNHRIPVFHMMIPQWDTHGAQYVYAQQYAYDSMSCQTYITHETYSTQSSFVNYLHDFLKIAVDSVPF